MFRKPLQRLEAAAKKCYEKKKFLQCQKILKDYKSEQKTFENTPRSAFLVRLQVLNIFQLNCLPFKNNCLSKKTSKKE